MGKKIWLWVVSVLCPPIHSLGVMDGNKLIDTIMGILWTVWAKAKGTPVQCVNKVLFAILHI